MAKPSVAAAPLHDWMERQYHLSARAMMGALSATHLVKERRPFGQTIRPVRGSVLASPVIASYDPDPDYFFHWARDSAVVIDALRHLIERKTLGLEALSHVVDFVDFSLGLQGLDGAAYLKRLGDFRAKVEPFYLQYVREDSDLAAIKGEAVQGEPRFNPDGTLDILKWSRPQHDGPASRALTLLRCWPLVEAYAPQSLAALQSLLRADLGFTLRHYREPSFDIWEEELGSHYYTKLLQSAALTEGARWFEARGDAREADACQGAAQELAVRLDDYWSAGAGFYLSRLHDTQALSDKSLDIATLLAVIHAGRLEGPHSILDPKVIATSARLEALFASSYAINKGCGASRGPAMGRYAGDLYYSGGAYYFSTLGAAEFYFRLSAAVAAGRPIPVTPENEGILRALLRMAAPGQGATDDVSLADYCARRDGREALAAALSAWGDAFMATIAAFTPESGALAEQFDQTSGEQTSAKNLAWSHAAFITAFASRQAAAAAA
jgi:glucoamylase